MGGRHLAYSYLVGFSLIQTLYTTVLYIAIRSRWKAEAVLDVQTYANVVRDHN